MQKYEIIKVSGKDRPIKFGFWALGQFCKECGIKLSELAALEKNLDLNQALTLIWVGLKDGARAAGVSFDLTKPDIGDAMDEDQELLPQALEVFGNFQAKPKEKSSKKK